MTIDVRAIITPQRFAQGFTYQGYLAQVKVNRERLQDNYEETFLAPEDAEFFATFSQRLGGSVKVLALAEDWCGDVVNYLPVMARIESVAPDMEMRIFPRDQNLDIMERYLNQGKYRSIPVFVFLDPDFRELGHWIERPQAATDYMARLHEELRRPGLSDEEIVRLVRRGASENIGRFRQEAVREIRQLLEAALTLRREERE